MVKQGGYVGRILRIDLSNRKSRTIEIAPELAGQWLGGNGFGVKTLWDEVPASVDPLSPENILILATGPLVGTAWPCSGRMEAIAKSPLTGIYGDSNCGGYFGPELKFAGVDALIITGASDRPVSLWIHDGIVDIEDAQELWGLDTVETEAAIRRAKGDEQIKVACIGPAGENLVPYASIQATPNRSFGRSGLGAVMGSKNLKAVAVRGKGRVPIASPQAFTALAKEMHRRIRENEFFPALARYGTSGLVSIVNEIGRFPTRNFQRGDYIHADKIGGEALRAEFWEKDDGCFACPIRCDKIYRVRTGEFAGAVTSSFEYETLNSFGAAVDNDNLASIIAANERCDRLGLDTISTGRAISFAMELYEKGILSTQDTGGMDLLWGDYKRVLELIEQIGQREGLGKLLSLGVRKAAEQIGGDAAYYAMEVKGQEIPAQDGRAQQSMGLAHITSSRGADHLKAFPTIDETGYTGEVIRRYGEEFLPEMADPQATKYKPFLVKDGEDLGAVVDSIGICKSGGTHVMAEIYWADIAEGLTLATGIDFTEDNVKAIGERIYNLMRAYNAIHGITRADDRLPRRFTEEPSPSTGAKGQIAHAEEMLDEYYTLRGWDPERGWPTHATLERLGLNDVVERMEAADG
ncbi:aldehyde ferredoxin oxidoreductase family protein [Candidatus Bipolaricaulota bacterium]|nr:aldehyde ferredoxin oxidoreductase family protein [Candidatus Bipolaricaulota bacterium]